MFSRMTMTKSSGTYSDHMKKLKEALANADAVVIGAGAGLSTSAGFVYDGERFKRHFAEYELSHHAFVELDDISLLIFQEILQLGDSFLQVFFASG